MLRRFLLALCGLWAVFITVVAETDHAWKAQIGGDYTMGWFVFGPFIAWFIGCMVWRYSVQGYYRYQSRLWRR